jgi:hypothetical protein
MCFEKRFTPDGGRLSSSGDLSPLQGFASCATGLTDFMKRYAGQSLNRGLYRVHPVELLDRWTANVLEAFPAFRSRILCFGYDWLGRHFALDRGRLTSGQCEVVMLEPGTGQALEIPAGLAQFHDVELVEHTNEALASDFHESWLASGGQPPGMDQCVGYKKPLFLGGSDTIDNLELSDMEVYWSVCAQLISQIRHMPDGTIIRDIDIR